MTYQAKTQPTAVSVDAYINAIDDPQRRADCQRLLQLMQSITGQPPVMWGASMIGFGSYHYRYASGHEGDAFLTGFASRKNDISVYIVAGFDGQQSLLGKLGKHKTAKSCLYIKRLADVDSEVLEQLIAYSVSQMRTRYPTK